MDKITIKPEQILTGHDSQDTAYLVEDYPYGFRLRCKIRYWLEHHSKRGTRLCSQTTDPRVSAGERWNKPKCSTYSSIAGCMYLNEDEYVTWTGLNEYSDIAESQGWYDMCKAGLPEDVQKRVEGWIAKKTAYETLRDLRRREPGNENWPF